MTRFEIIPKGILLSVLVFGIAITANQKSHVHAAAVMSVDLGTESMKVGVVSPGVPMEIALNKESKRKTPAILAFRDGIRTFGEDAITVGIRDPTTAYGYLLDLLGKTIDNPIVDLYRSRFPYYELVADENRKTVIFKKSDTEQFSVEELIAQMLVKAKEFAQEATMQKITECVLVVPGFFGQAERSAIMAAAHLADLKVLQLINNYAAIALNYGVFHRAEINETAQYFVFYDMGAYKTSAAVVSYQLVKDKVSRETIPVVQVLGVGYDRTLGGLEIQLRLRDYLAAEFNGMKKTKTDVTKSPRALAKLFKEAGRLKNVLSANNDHYAQIENLLEDHDFRLKVTRENLEEMCADLWPRVTKPLEDAIKASGLPLDVMSQVIIFGGGSRVPKVQEILKDSVKQELGKSINFDEAAAMGAVYKAADLATGFKVKKFIVKDAVLFPIIVSFERDQGDGSSIKQVKRVLFGPMNYYPQKKVITFNKHTNDFEFNVYYGDLTHLSETEISYIGTMNLTRVQLEQVSETLKKTENEIVESKGFKAYFALDDSGFFHSTGVDYVYEKQKPAEKEDKEGTFAKIGNTFSKLFSKEGGESEAKTADNSTAEEQSEEKLNETETETETAKGEGLPFFPDNSSAKADDKENAKADAVKTVTIKQPVTHKVNLQFTVPLEGESYKTSFEKLDAINKVENERNRKESALNALEAHVFDVQQKLQDEEYANCVTEEEKEKILAECSSISDWIDEGEESDINTYEKRLNDLKMMTSVFLGRHWEHRERPEALKSLSGMIDESKKFLNSAKNLTKEANIEKDIFTQIEIETLTKIIDDTVAWKKIESAAQKKLKRHEELRMTVKDITDKMSLLDREIKYMINKIKIWKPKVKPVSVETVSKDEAEKIESGSGGDSEEQKEAPATDDPLTDHENKKIPLEPSENNEEATPRTDL